MAISSPEIAAVFNKTKAPYNISTPTSVLAVKAVEPNGIAQMRSMIVQIKEQKQQLITKLQQIPGIGRVIGGRDANFVIAEILNSDGAPDSKVAHAVYKRLAEHEAIVIRYRGNELGCEGCLRITIGTPQENAVLLDTLARQNA